MGPMLLDFPGIYKLYKDQAQRQTEDNLMEWQDRLCQRASLPDLYYIIYKAMPSELEDLRAAMTSDRISLSYLGASLADNSFVRFIYRNKCVEIVDYLLYAKRCEPYAVRPTGWDKPALAKAEMQRIINDGRERFLRIESHYIRLRYAYQMIRLAHYMKDYQQVLDLCDYLLPKIDNDPSLVEYWIKGHKAGALLALGKNVEASYLYSQVFDRCPSKRESAFRSFRIKTDDEWKQCLLLCQSDHQRATLYALRAYADDSKLVEEMQHIYDYEPQNEFLEVLLVREMAQLERDLLGLEFNDNKAQNKRYFGRPRPIAGQLIIDLQAFVRKILQEGQIENTGIWKIAEGYLELLAGNYYFAEKTFAAAREMVAPNDTLGQQLDIMEAALHVSALLKPDSAAEATADEVRRSDLYRQYRSLPGFLTDKMAHLYEEANRPGMAFITKHSIKELKVIPEFKILEDLIAVCRKPVRTRWEKWLVEKPDGSTIEKDLIDIKATMLMSDYHLEAALETLKEMPRAEWDNYGVFNPYVDRVRDCVRCPLIDTMALYNKGELIENMLDLEYRAKAATDPDEGAKYFYRLGIAFYNMSYFGYSWKAMDYFRSSASSVRYRRGSKDFVFSNRDYPLGNRENFDCSQALYYFEKARILAKDKELGARAVFWAAKCEQKMHFINNPAGVEPSRQYFALLRKSYANTDYIGRVVRECKYFQYYVSK